MLTLLYRNNIFFMTAYHFVPVVHAARYYEAFYGGPLRRPPMCLQYAVMTLAAVGHPKYDTYADVFYKRARQYIQADEMKVFLPRNASLCISANLFSQGQGEHFITLAHAQSWVLIATYEARVMLFTRASMSCSRSVRICQMMGLDRIDGGPNDLPPALGPATTWSELEERRRVFWGAFTIDCHASIATGWPCLINQDDVSICYFLAFPAFSDLKLDHDPSALFRTCVLFRHERRDGILARGFQRCFIRRVRGDSRRLLNL